MSIQRVLPLLVVSCVILLSGCATSGTVEPVAEVAVTQTAPALVPVTPIADTPSYPPPLPTGTGYPAPEPTATFGPTPTPDTPRTLEPSPTVPPLPTLISTPEVTPIPTAETPFIPLPPDQEPQPFSILYTEGSTIWAVDSSSGGDPYPLVNVQDALSLYIAPISVTFGKWGAASPDGTMLAAVLSSQETYDHTQDDYPEISLYLYDVQQQTWAKLVDEGIEPVWSPDGTQIAYRGPQEGLWVIDVATGESREVYAVEHENGHFATDFSWARDSQRLVFMDRVVQGTRDIVIIDVTQPESVTILIPDEPYRPYNARWSSMSEQILFASHVGVQSASDDITNLWVINSDGSGAIQITQDLETMTGSSPSLSPNDEWIAIAGHINYEAIEVSIDLWLVNSKNGELRRLTDTPDINELRPLRSFDGTYLVFQRAANDSDGSLQSMWVINLYDGSETELASFSVQDLVLLPQT